MDFSRKILWVNNLRRMHTADLVAVFVSSDPFCFSAKKHLISMAKIGLERWKKDGCAHSEITHLTINVHSTSSSRLIACFQVASSTSGIWDMYFWRRRRLDRRKGLDNCLKIIFKVLLFYGSYVILVICARCTGVDWESMPCIALDGVFVLLQLWRIGFRLLIALDCRTVVWVNFLTVKGLNYGMQHLHDH